METGAELLSRSPYCGSWMVSLTVARRPAVRGGRMARRQQRRAGEQFLAQGAGAIVALVDAALLQDRHDQVDEILETLGGHDAAEVEAVAVDLVTSATPAVVTGGCRPQGSKLCWLPPVSCPPMTHYVFPPPRGPDQGLSLLLVEVPSRGIERTGNTEQAGTNRRQNRLCLDYVLPIASMTQELEILASGDPVAGDSARRRRGQATRGSSLLAVKPPLTNLAERGSGGVTPFRVQADSR